MKEDLHPAGLELRERACFAELRHPIHTHAMTVVHRREVADDLTQETFLRLYIHLAEGHEVGNVKAWTFRVCHNLAINHLKRNSRAAVLDAGGIYAHDDEDLLAAPGADPERLLLDKERSRQLEAGISHLTDHQRRCLYLRAAGCRYREIAQRLNIAVSSVVDALTRAVERLRKEQGLHSHAWTGSDQPQPVQRNKTIESPGTSA